MDAGGIWSWLRNRNPPTLGVATYQLVDEKPVLTDGSLTVEVDPADIEQDQIRLGVPIAITNMEADDLNLVRVELRYPADLTVKSAGQGKIDPTGRTIVYDHDIGTLRSSGGDFTPIAPLDEVIIPFQFAFIPTVSLSRDGVPFYLVAVAGAGSYPFNAKKVTMEANIYFSDRPAVSADIHWSVEPGVEILGQGSDNFVQRPLTEQEVAAFAVPDGEPVQEWTQEVGSPQQQVQYKKFEKQDSGATQAITVDGVLRRVIIDSDGDGYVDLDMFDDSGDGRPDAGGEYPEGRLFVDWWDS